MSQKNNQIFRYLLVGGFNVFFTLGVYTILLITLGGDKNIQLIYWLSAIIGIVNGFFWQKIFVWKNKGSWSLEFFKFLVLNLFVSLLNSLALFVFVQLLDSDPLVSQFIITAVLVIISFILSKNWVFMTKAFRG